MKNEVNTCKQTNFSYKLLHFFSIIGKKYFIIYAAIVLICVLSILSDSFFTYNNLMNVLRQCSMIAIIAVGMMFVIVTTGIDISVGSTVGLSGVIMALLLVDYNWPVFLGILGGLAVGTAVGVINGYLISKRKLPAFVATLGTMGAARGLTYVLTDAYPISGLPESISFIGRGYVGIIPVPVIIMVAIYILAYIVAEKTKTGRFIFALGGNQQAARLSGIKVDKYLMIVYSAIGFLSGLSGIILVSRLASGQPNGGLGFEFEAITATVIGGTSFYGGKGTVLGTFFGAIFIALLLNGMVLLDISSYYQQMIKGIVLIIAVMIDVNKNEKL